LDGASGELPEAGLGEVVGGDYNNHVEHQPDLPD
jgi:hypothetical protein